MLNTDKDAILRGLFDGTKDLKPIFITGGTESGIMKYVGEARAKYNPTAVNTPALTLSFLLSLSLSLSISLSPSSFLSLPLSVALACLIPLSPSLPLSVTFCKQQLA
jgi:O-antigen/teichoic acid export membrane protein